MGAPRALSEAERDGATIKRGDLRQVIAILKAIGVPELVRRAPPAPRPSRQKLLQLPLLPQEHERCNRLLVDVARSAPHGRVANLAMRLMSAVHDAGADTHGPTDESQIGALIAQLRAAGEEAESAKS